MIRYNASDVIKKAKQLADLENSDFISWNESITLLNDAYQNIYQKALIKETMILLELFKQVKSV